MIDIRKTEKVQEKSKTIKAGDKIDLSQFEKKPKVKKGKDKIPETAKNYPEHIVDIALILKNNSQIRRFTSIGVINYLLQKDVIKGKKRYVYFAWNKFSVKCDGITKEYLYSEPFFLNCLVASFASFASASQKTIDIFTNKELGDSIGNVVSGDEVSKIVEGINDRETADKEN